MKVTRQKKIYKDEYQHKEEVEEQSKQRSTNERKISDEF